MIGKITKGTSFAGALRYDIEKENAKMLDTNLAADMRDWNVMAAEMDAMADCNSRCQKRTLHFSFSASPGEKLTDEQWKKGSFAALKELGLEKHQHVITRHLDAQHDHIHIVVNRVGSDGKAWSDSNDRARVHQASRAMEKELGLQPVKGRELARDGRFEKTRADLRDSVKAAGGRGLDGFKSEMGKRGYDVIENRQATGRLSGLSIQSREDGKTWKASELQKGGARGITAQLDKQQEPQQRQEGRELSRAVGKTIAGNLPCVPIPGLGGGLGKVAAQVAKATAQSVKKQRAMER